MAVKTAEKLVEPRVPLPNSTISHLRLETLQDLLQAIRTLNSSQEHLVAMLGATAAHVSMCMGLPPDKISILSLADVRPELRAYLTRRGLQRNSVRSYINYLRIFLQKAKGLGWSDVSPDVERAWWEVFGATASTQGCSRVIRHAVRKGRTPKDFTEADLTDWADSAQRLGRNVIYVQRVMFQFKKSIFDAGIGSLFPNLSPAKPGKLYGVPISDFPEALRIQVENLVKWKTAEFSKGRPSKCKVRFSSAVHLIDLASELFGFLLRIKERKVSRLEELFSQQSVSDFVDWCMNERMVSGQTLRPCLGTIQGLTSYPPFESLDFSWLPRLAAQLSTDRSESVEKKCKRWVDYDRLVQIPDQILAGAEKLRGFADKRKALMIRDALLIRWLVTLPWRQRNIRECKIQRFAHGGNLSREEFPAHLRIAKPDWVEEALRANPTERFWQFYFRAHETKTACVVRAIVPKQLITPLEDYLDHYRPALVNGMDPGTLFINSRGHPFTAYSIYCLVRNLTAKYVGRQVNPHLFRDIFAVQWLHEHPEGYLTLSKILWHRDTKTTVQIYGAGYDESYGALGVEQWLDARKLNRTRL